MFLMSTDLACPDREQINLGKFRNNNFKNLLFEGVMAPLLAEFD